MSFAAVEQKRLYKQCRECGGHGEDCEACGGEGEIYVGPSGEPEDYAERDDE